MELEHAGALAVEGGGRVNAIRCIEQFNGTSVLNLLWQEVETIQFLISFII